MNLDMGRSYVGLMNTSHQEGYDINIFRWKLLCKNFLLSSKTWSGLIPAYQVRWPLNIIFNDALLEKLEQMFQLIFPFKIAKHKLSEIYIDINLLTQEIDQTKIFTYFTHIRAILNNFVSSFLDYVY